MGRLLKSPFRPAWWLSNAHLQTLWPAWFRRRRPPALEAERLELDDGDFIDLSWVRGAQGPCVLVLHGLEGSLDSHYAGGTLSALAAAGYRPVFMYFRGCSGTPNRLPRGYHSGATEDLLSVLAHLAGRLGEPPYAAVGYSLGGNLLLKYLGERPPPIPLRAAVAISVPFRLGDAVGRLERGFSRLYQRHLVGRLRASYQHKFATLPSPLGVDVSRLRSPPGSFIIRVLTWHSCTLHKLPPLSTTRYRHRPHQTNQLALLKQFARTRQPVSVPHTSAPPARLPRAASASTRPAH